MQNLPEKKDNHDDPGTLEIFRAQCWNNALHAYATSYIFQRRARILRNRLQLINYIGFVVPMIVGLLVLAYGQFKALEVVVAIAAAIIVAQVAISLWSIIGGWVDGYSYAITSITDNSQLASAYEELAVNPPEDTSELRNENEKLKIRDANREEQDYKQGIKEAEKRMGMRAGLRKYRRQCASCNKVPESMNPTDCQVCGDFRYRIH